VAAGIGAAVRLSLLMPSVKQRVRLPIVFLVIFLIALAVGLAKRQALMHSMVIYFDVAAALLVSLVGAGPHIRAAAVQQMETGSADPVPSDVSARRHSRADHGSPVAGLGIRIPVAPVVLGQPRRCALAVYLAGGQRLTVGTRVPARPDRTGWGRRGRK
jgi:hypothetical protein